MYRKNCHRIVFLLGMIAMIGITGCGNIKKQDEDKNRGKKIVFPNDSSYYEGTEKPAINIVDELESLGFTNIKTIEDEPGMYYHCVKSVKICKKDSKKAEEFEKDDVAYSNDLIEIHYYGSEFEDGMIYGTDIFELEEYIRKFNDISWDDDYSVGEGLSGYYGTLMAKDDDVDASLYGNDLKEVESASLAVPFEKLDLLKEFAAYFDTKLINVDEVEMWLDEYLGTEEAQSKVFGDAEFTLTYDLGNNSKFQLSVRAVEKD